jgi:hypothetical protein
VHKSAAEPPGAHQGRDEGRGGRDAGRKTCEIGGDSIGRGRPLGIDAVDDRLGGTEPALFDFVSNSGLVQSGGCYMT